MWFHFDMVIFNRLLLGMSLLAVAVFIALFFVDAGYGAFYSKKWGIWLPNKLGWTLMETPVFIAMTLLWSCSDRIFEVVPFFFLALFQLHYLQRAFIFPFLMRGKGKMSLAVVAMGIIFNVINAIMQGGWIFYLAPEDRYTIDWLTTPQCIIGILLFFTGMVINLHSDNIIRNLRKPGDTRHYLPKGGMFRYVTSANYFGEWVEWVGFAVLTWSLPGAVFAWWTFANLAPRAARIHKRYKKEFGDEFGTKKVKRMIPFIF